MIGLFSIFFRHPRLNLALMAVSGGALSLMLTAVNIGLVFNDTHSAPFGLYVHTANAAKTDHESAPYVFFCPDIRWPSLRGQPNYRSPMWTCPDGFAPLIKPVVAWPGDIVETTPTGVKVNGSMIQHTVPLNHDSKGRSIHPYPYGTYRVPQGQLWVVSAFSPRSFDSRYFGPIPLRCVHLWVRPLLVEKKYHPESQ